MSDDAVFKALADASRRKLLDRLRQRNSQTLGELCGGLNMTRQAVAKHLAVLKKANLVSWRRKGRERFHFINPVPIGEIAERWIRNFEHPRLQALSTLKRNREPGTREQFRLRHIYPHNSGETLVRADRPRADERILVRNAYRDAME